MAPSRGKPRGKAGKKGEVDAKAIKVAARGALKREIRNQARRLTRRANATLKRKQSYPDYSYSIKDEEGDLSAKVYTRSNHAKHSNAIHNTLAKLG